MSDDWVFVSVVAGFALILWGVIALLSAEEPRRIPADQPVQYEYRQSDGPCPTNMPVKAWGRCVNEALGAK